MTLDLSVIREQFPALNSEDIFLDNPGGTQIAKQSIKGMMTYLTENNANHGGAFITSRMSDQVIDVARAAAADFVNAARPEEIVFGPNMTSLTFNLSRSLAQTLNPGDTIVVTHLDHDANITPWRMIAEERGCFVRWVDFHLHDGSLNLDSLRAALDTKPRILAVGYASNALGTINPVGKITKWAHDAGALVYIDAVQYAPHGPIDVQALGCDFLTCSAYKFFGPHIGFLYGKYDLLEELKAYRVRPAPENPPGKFETGTQNHEGIAGLRGALDHLAWIGKSYGEDYIDKYSSRFKGRKLLLKQGMAAIRAYEYEISRKLHTALTETPGVKLYGPNDVRHLEKRVPTFSFNIEGLHPRHVAEHFAQEGIYLWDGNYYALAVTEQLELETNGGMVRVGAAHYNTLEEIDRFESVLKDVVRGR